VWTEGSSHEAAAAGVDVLQARGPAPEDGCFARPGVAKPKDELATRPSRRSAGAAESMIAVLLATAGQRLRATGS
jgi:hypothetical protein